MRRARDRGFGLGTIAVLVSAFAFVSCGPLPPPQTSGVPAATRPAPRPAVPAAASPRAAAVDSTPSPDAVRVLGTIPDPIPEAQRIPPPEPGAQSDSGGASITPAIEPPDSGASGADAPVPTPTHALGDRPNPMATDSSATRSDPSAAGAAPPGASTPPTSAPPSTVAPPASGSARAPSASDTCWRVQVAAPAEAEKASGLRDAAQSQLLVPMVIEREQRLYKVRTRDCWGRPAADALRTRAIASGFSGSFLFVGAKP